MRQADCILIPHVCSFYSVHVMREVLNEKTLVLRLLWGTGTTLGILIILSCCSTEKMKESLKIVYEVIRKKKLFLNPALRHRGSISSSKAKISRDTVEEFDFHESRIRENCCCCAEIESTQATVKFFFADLSELWKSRDFPVATKWEEDSTVFSISAQSYGYENLK